MVPSLTERVFYQGYRWEHTMTSQGDTGPRCKGCTREKQFILSGVGELSAGVSQAACHRQQAAPLEEDVAAWVGGGGEGADFPRLLVTSGPESH